MMDTPFKKIFYVYISVPLFVVIAYIHAEVRGHLNGVATLSTMWVLGLKLRPSGLVAANVFTHRTTSPAYVLLIKEMLGHHGVRTLSMLSENSLSLQLERVSRVTDGPCP